MDLIQNRNLKALMKKILKSSSSKRLLNLIVLMVFLVGCQATEGNVDTPTPTIEFLDNFNREDGALGADWSGTTSGYSVMSNRMDVDAGDAIFWATEFGADQEVFTTFTTVDPTGEEQDLLLKSQSSTSWESGVIELLYSAVEKTVKVTSYSAEQGWVQYGSSIPVTFENGDRFGARAKADGTVEVYRNGTLIASQDVSEWTYASNGGYIGLWFIDAGDAVIDDFGGGNPTGGSTSVPPSATPTIPADTPTLTETESPINEPTSTPTNGPSSIPTNTSNAPVSSVFFPVGRGGSDVTPHQVVRTNADYLYLFANQQSSPLLLVYKTTGTGLPDSQSAFDTPIQLTETSNPISVDAVYDGGTIIHTLINTQDGDFKDYPFDTTTNTFKSPIILASDAGTVTSGLYVGTGGVAGMFDLSGTLHIAYWTNNNHIQHQAYTYDSSSNTLTPAGDAFQVDTAGNANHPAIAVSPSDNSLTIAWVSQADSPTQIRTRTRASNGTWGSVESASTVPVWTSSDNGINIDQGPSLLIDAAGVKHLAYIQSFDASVGDYGRVHYVTDNGSGWVDQALNVFSHDPALALSTSGHFYIIGHGHPKNGSCQSMDDMCMVEKNANGNWGSPALFAAPPAGRSFDSSPSVKWSAVGFNRSNAVEFVFFGTPYDSPTLYYGRLP